MDYDFAKTVLLLSFDDLKAPLQSAISQRPLPRRIRDLEQYYSNFLPFLLEEARANIANGLEKVKVYLEAQNQVRNRENYRGNHRRNNNNNNHPQIEESKPFKLLLLREANLPRYSSSILTLNFEGGIPKNIDHGLSMNALLLKIPEAEAVLFPRLQQKEWLAIASESLDGTKTTAKIILSSVDFEYIDQCINDGTNHPFQKQFKWQAHFLGCVVSEQRMFENCRELFDSPCVRLIMNAQVARPNTMPSHHVLPEVKQKMNLSQTQAINAFFNADCHSVMLLQGPPGTGKTTTLVNLLKCVSVQEKRILVSAHSNKGVQVLALRANKELPDIPMILIGVTSKVPHELRGIFFDGWYDFIEQRLGEFNNTDENRHDDLELLNKISTNVSSIKAMLSRFKLLFTQKMKKDEQMVLLKVCDHNPLTLQEFEAINAVMNLIRRERGRVENWNQLYRLKEAILYKWSQISKSAIEEHLLTHSKIIFATLITCGRSTLGDMPKVDYLLVDEASQSVEAATLIPLRFRPDKVLLVGDTQQLPATVISPFLDEAPETHSDTHFKWSMMWRLIVENKCPSLMLDLQYRMHPHICQWPSEKYYENKLITAPDILPMILLSENGITSRPYAIYLVNGREETPNFSNSMTNPIEADYTVKIINLIRQQSSSNNTNRIGVITPYAAQKTLITKKLKDKKLLNDLVDVNTVDGFQGDERDIIIISFTRTHVTTFLKEFRRLNVAVTRPKYCLIILAHPRLIDYDIGEMLKDAQRRQCVFSEENLKLILSTRRVITSPVLHPSASLHDRATSGNAQAQYEYSRQLTPSSSSSSFLWLRRAAEQNHSEAQFELSKSYERNGTNPILSLKWLIKSAQAGFVNAQMAVIAKFMRKEIDQTLLSSEMAIAYCEVAASHNNHNNNNSVEIILFLGKCYQFGHYVPRNHLKAIHYYQQAASLTNHVGAMMELVRFYDSGLLPAADVVVWLRRLVQQAGEHSYAYLLSTLLEESEESYRFLMIAADSGHRDAQYTLAQILKEGRGGGGNHYIPMNIIRSVYYSKQLADVGEERGLILLVELMQQNENMTFPNISLQDRNRYYLRASSSAKHIPSHYYFGKSLFDCNHSDAYLYLKKAVDGHYPPAFYYFAILEGQRTSTEGNEGNEERNIGNALKYFKRSIAAGLHVVSSKTYCIHYQIQYNIELDQCLQYCEDLLFLDNHSSLSFVYARLLETGIAGRQDIRKALNLYLELSQHDTHTVASYYASLLLSDKDSEYYDRTGAIACFDRCHTQITEVKLRYACFLLDDEKLDIPLVESLLEQYCQESLNDSIVGLLSEIERNLENIISSSKAAVTAAAAAAAASVPSDSFVIGSDFSEITPKIDYYFGKIFEEGKGIPVDYVRAFNHYLSAAKGNDVEGIYRVGYCNEYGIGTRKDLRQAYKCYKEAASKGHPLAKEKLTWGYSVRSTCKDISCILS